VANLGKILQAFYDDLAATPDDSCGGASLADNIVLTIHGDTPKNPLDRSGWPDGTQGNSNWVYVMGNGMLKTGWFGGINRQGGVQGFRGGTGEQAGYDGGAQAQAAAAAIAYAIAKGDVRRTSDFARGINISGITNAVQM
jgi:hypothetical protein